MEFIEIVNGVATSVASAGVLAIIALAIKPLRVALVFKTHEYVLVHHSESRRCEWDIQWEGQRLTIKADNVHNDYLENVTLIYNDQAPGESLGSMNVSREFFPRVSPRVSWPIKVQLSGIVKRTSDSGREYSVHFVVRRRRW